MSRERGPGRGGGKKFEEVFRVYHEVEDVGKTVKQSKRRARWTFSFGEGGAEREIVLIHSVVSGKKIVMYDGQEIYHSDEMSRAFSYSWYDQEHVLRLDIIDIVEVGTQIAKNRSDKMYELTIDGVPFGVLNLKPLHLPGRQASSRNASGGHRAVERSADLDDDFDPRASPQPAVSSSAKPKAVVQAKAAPVVDLLSMDAPATVPTLPAPTGVASFDPFGGGGGANDFNPRGKSSVDPFAPTSSFDVVKPKPVPGFGANTLTAEELAAQVGAVSFAPRPQLTYGGPSMTATPSSPAPADFSGFQVARTGPSTPDVEKATASLVNLNNLLDDSPASKQQAAFKPVYTDNRSLEEMKATSRSSQPAKPVFIERPAPAFGPGPGAIGGMGGAPRPGGFPQGPPMAGGGFGGAPSFGAFPQQPRPMGFGPPIGMQQQSGGFPMTGNAGGFGQPMQMQGGGFGALPSAAPRGMMMAFPPRPPPSNDPFQGLGL